jgi:hypothetical protein
MSPARCSEEDLKAKNSAVEAPAAAQKEFARIPPCASEPRLGGY